MGSVRRGGNNAFFLFLGLNILVSLVTVLAVLSIWDRRRPASTPLPTSTIDAAALLASAIPTATETLVPTPTPSVYRVQPNDTLFGIALQLGVSLADLMELNDLTESSVLDVGQVLLVPTPGGPAAPTDTPAPQAQASPTRPAEAETPQVVIVGVAGVGGVATDGDGKRLAAGGGNDAGDAPSAQNGVRDTIPVRTPLLMATEWQIPDRGQHEPILEMLVVQ